MLIAIIKYNITVRFIEFSTLLELDKSPVIKAPIIEEIIDMVMILFKLTFLDTTSLLMEKLFSHRKTPAHVTVTILSIMVEIKSKIDIILISVLILILYAL